MDDESTRSDQAWRYITALYADEALARELLRRQDEEGLDVVLHLFTHWAAAQGRTLDAETLAQADVHVAGWRAQVIAPLRQLRGAMNQMAHTTGARIAAVRREVQAAELAAERAELEMLCDWLRMQ